MPTWNTLGALTREAKAEERVAEKIPAVMRGLKPDTTLITFFFFGGGQGYLVSCQLNTYTLILTLISCQLNTYPLHQYTRHNLT